MTDQTELQLTFPDPPTLIAAFGYDSDPKDYMERYNPTRCALIKFFRRIAGQTKTPAQIVKDWRTTVREVLGTGVPQSTVQIWETAFGKDMVIYPLFDFLRAPFLDDADEDLRLITILHQILDLL